MKGRAFVSDKSRVTLQEIATEAGVSRPLVSNILNGRGRASKEVMVRVEQLLAEHGFRPKIGRRPFFFLERSHFQVHSRAMCMQLLSAVQEPMADAGAMLHLALLRDAEDLTEASFRVQLAGVLQNRPGGFILNTTSGWTPMACEVLAELDIPFVQVGYDAESPAYPAVVVDGFAGAQMATCYLLEQGHTRIAMIRWQATALTRLTSDKKYAGYEAALSDAGLSVEAALVTDVHALTAGDLGSAVRGAVAELLELEHPPTAVFVENSYLSASLLYPMAGDGGEAPEAIRGLEMVHFEDWPLSAGQILMEQKLGYPPCETVAVTIDWARIGEVAAHRLIELARRGKDLNTLVTRVSPILQRVSGIHRTEISTENC